MHAAKILAVAAAAALAFPPAAAIAETVNLSASLTPPTYRKLEGSKEVGQATVQIDSDKSQICYQIQVTVRSKPVTTLLLREGGQGPVLVTRLLAPDKVTQAISGCAPLSPEHVKSILQNPSAYQVNIGTVEDSTETLRGKLRR
jgi:hypothetical protein